MIGAPLDVSSDLTADLVQPFQLELSNVRGRAVRLGQVLENVLNLHDYPPQIQQLAAEAMTATVLLASLLKYEGVFTLQVKGDGPVSMLVVDVTSAGDVRAYARFDEGKLPQPDERPGIDRLFGKGYLAFTVDQGDHTENYQGIVALTGPNLTDCLEHYFDQSEQLLTSVKLAARHYPDGWRAGAVLIQRLPEDDAGRVVKNPAEDEEDWRRASILMNTVAEVELFDRTLHLNGLLYRLFHEERIRVFPPSAFRQGCRCSAQRVEEVLQSIPRAELADLKVDGAVVVTCEFCSTAYRYDDTAIDSLFGTL